MPPLMPLGAFNAPFTGPVMLIIGVAVAVVCVVILVCFYRPQRLDARIRARRAVPGDGSTAAMGSAGAAPFHGGFDGGGFDGGGFDGGGGGDC